MKRTEIPAVKVEGYVTEGELEDHYYPFRRGTTIPCILRTAAADKLILDVVRAAIAEKTAGDALDANSKGKAEWDALESGITALRAAIQKLENAGVKL